MAESLEEAREIVVYDLIKSRERGCNFCLIPEEPDYQNMNFGEKAERMDRHFNEDGTYVLRNWIRDTEPKIYEEKKLIRG
jgi:hypothetical protein